MKRFNREIIYEKKMKHSGDVVRGLNEHVDLHSFGAGFTIIEMAISIFILSVAIIVVFGAFSLMIILSSDAEDRLLASYLAQEGIEIIRNIRDNNWLASADNPEFAAWDEGLEVCESATGCEVDYKTTGFEANPVYPWQDRFLKINKASHFYEYESGSETKFKRKITIDRTLAPHILKVKAEVFWKKKPSIINFGNGYGVIEIEDILYDWY